MLTNSQKRQFWSILEDQQQYIKIYHIRKSNGKYRKIIAPSDEYKEILHAISGHFSDNGLFPLSNISHAWEKGKDRFTCAAIHVGKKYLLKADIKDFFGHVTEDHLKSLFEKHNIYEVDGIPYEDIVYFLTMNKNKHSRIRTLGQGFPSSPYFANAARYDFDTDLIDLCKDETSVSVYGDNLYISGDHIPGETKNKLKDIARQYKFYLHDLEIVHYGERQEVLSVTVNEKISIPKDYMKSVIGDLVYRLNNGIGLDASISGKINVLRHAENPRVFNYAVRLADKIKSEV